MGKGGSPCSCPWSKLASPLRDDKGTSEVVREMEG